MGTGFCSSIPRYFDRYVQYIDRQPTLELTDVGEYDIDQLYTVLLGPLESGEYYNRKDLNGDGVNELYKASEDSEGNEVISTVYGRDDKFQKYELSYDDWLEQYGQDEGPDLSELIAEYGEDVVNDLKGKYDELVDFIGNVPEDPVGSIKKMAEIFVEGTTGIPPECQRVAGGPLDNWHLECITVGVLIEIGFPGLPAGVGGIFKGATIGEIKDALEKIGKKFEDIVDGNPTCGEDGTQECTPITILGDLAREVIDSIGSIFEDAEGNITVETVLGKIGGIFGTVLGGIIYEEFKDLINDEIEDVIGIPVIPFAPLDECESKDLETIETSPGQYECGGCKEEGFTPTGPQGECVDPNAVEAFDETQCVEEDYFNENKTDCEAAGYVNCAGGENTGGQETTGGIIKGTLDDCDVIQDPQCSDVGTYNSDTGECDCPEGYEFEVETGGTCGEKTSDDDGTYDPVCTEPRPAGELTFELEEQQMMWDQQCAATHCPTGKEYDYFPEDTNKSGSFEYQGELYTYDPCDPLGKENSLTSTPIDDGGTETGGSCPEGSERDDPFYDSRDTDQSGFFVSNGITYSYDPCNPSSGFSVVGQNVNVCEDQNNLNYGNIVQQPEEPCGDCKSGFDKPQGYTNCTSFEDLCRDQAPGYGPNDDNPACGEITEVVCDPITDANADECGYKKCDNNTYVPKDEQCPITVDPCETIDATNADECGYKKCDNGTYIPKDEQCPITVDPCDDPVYAAENQDECGPIVDPCDDPVYAAENPQECGYTCDDPNATVLEGGLTPGACGPCKEGYVFDGAVERCVQESVDPCDDPEYATANPTECGTTPPLDCSDPEYAAANPEECAPAPPPETGGGGGGGGGGAGAFSPFIAGIDYTPQALPTAPAAPQKDYMMELDNLIKRSLFEGIV
jgi:hypothetical protein